jgi:hypothetical protein
MFVPASDVYSGLSTCLSKHLFRQPKFIKLKYYEDANKKLHFINIYQVIV